MQLLVAMKERLARIVRDEINLHRAIGSDVDHILDKPRTLSSRNAHDLKAVPVQMQGMRLAARVDKGDAIPSPLLYADRRRIQKGLAIHSPTLKTILACRGRREDHLQFFGRKRLSNLVGEIQIIPTDVSWIDPNKRTCRACTSTV